MSLWFNKSSFAKSIAAPGLSALLLLAAALALPGCERMREGPRPEGVPENARWDGGRRIWVAEGQDGVLKTYFESGIVASQGQIADGKRIGYWRTFTMRGDQVASRGLYEDGWREGLWEYLDDQGRLYLSVEYRQEPKRSFGLLFTTDYGNENGPYKRYYPDGSLEEEGRFYSGYFQGPMRRYHRNGELAVTGQYDRDEPVGEWRYFYPDGSLERVERYRDGELHGVFESYYPDGQPYHRTVYADGQEVGPKTIQPRGGR